MCHLTSSLSSHIFTPSLLPSSPFLSSSPTTCILHVGSNVALNPGLERACIHCRHDRTLLPNPQKSPLENLECRLEQNQCRLKCSPEPRPGASLYTFARKKGQISKNGKYAFAALFLFKIEAGYAVHPCTSLSPRRRSQPRRRHDLSVEAANSHDASRSADAPTRRNASPPSDFVGFNTWCTYRLFTYKPAHCAEICPALDYHLCIPAPSLQANHVYSVAFRKGKIHFE
jgi:hypothetical protein